MGDKRGDQMFYGKLDINTISGSTVWFNQKLSRNIKIEYDVTTLGDGVQNLPHLEESGHTDGARP
ncbi:hypothetical protein ACFL6U_31720 [Planctomycetota bacterium]